MISGLLASRPRELPQEFWDEVHAETSLRLQMACRVAAVILTIFFLIYLSVFPPEIQVFVTIFHGTVLVLTFVGATVPAPASARGSILGAIALVTLFSLQVNGTMALTEGPGDRYYYAQVLADVYLITGIGIFVPWPTLPTVLLALIPFGSQVAVSFAWPLPLQVLPLGFGLLAVVGAGLARWTKFGTRVDEWEARRRNERLAEAERDLIAMLTHDLANPLGSIITTSRLIAQEEEEEEDDRDGEVVEMSRWIVQSAHRVLDMTGNFVDASVLEVEGSAVHRESLRLDHLVRDLLLQEAGRARNRDMNLLCRAPEPVEISADREKVLRVVANLVSNAFKFTPAGGTVTVAVEPHEHGGARLTVSDTGPGVPREARKRLFRRFGRESQHGDSTGLGLYIVRSFVEAHGGTVELADTPEGEGATFVVVLPAAPRSAGTRPETNPEESPGSTS